MLLMENIPEELPSAVHRGFMNFRIMEITISAGSAEIYPSPKHCVNSSWKSLWIRNYLWPNYTFIYSALTKGMILN